MAVQRIGKYQITAEIGSGGFGRVYAAQDPSVGRVVAIKVMNAPGDTDMVKRFRAEARTVAMLAHKNIVTVHDFGEQEGAPYLVMEYLEGVNLDGLIKQGNLSLLEKVEIMIEVAEGLSCAHRQGITHRDVKPANIMRLADGTVKIMDFGIARIAAGGGAARLTQTGFIVGTWSYMAPEQFNGTSDPQTDIFAFGVTFYELLTGRNPFQAADPAGIFNKITTQDPAPVSSLIAGCPADLDRLVQKTLAKDRGVRYADLQDLIVDAKPIMYELRRDEAVHTYAKAKELLTAGQLEAAQAAVRKTLDLDPTNSGARQLRSQIEKEVHRRDSTVKAGTLLEKAEKELRERQFQEASETLASVRQMLPGDSPLQSRLMRADAQIENVRRLAKLLDSARENLRRLEYNEAFKSVREALAVDPNNNTGKALLEEIRNGQALREAQRRLQEEMARIEEMLLTGDTEQALNQVRDLERKNPASPELVNLRQRVENQWAEESRRQRLANGINDCKTLVKNHQFEDAVNKANMLLADFPDARELKNLARLAEDRLAAKKRAEQIARVKTDVAAYMARQDFDYAIRLLETALQKLGDDQDLVGLLQNAMTAKETFERQQQQARAVDEARHLRRQRKYDEALAAIDRASQMYGDGPDLQSLAQEIYAEKREQIVREVARRAQAALDQQNPETAAIGLRECLKRNGDDSELRRLLDTAEAQIRERERTQRSQAILDNARQLAAARCFEDALSTIDDGLRQLPGDGSLAAERKRIAAAMEADQREQERQREEAQRQREEAQRQREEAQRQREEVQRQREEAQRREIEARRREAEAERQREEARRQQEINATLKEARTAREKGLSEAATQILNAAVLKHGNAAPLLDFQRELEQTIEEQRRTQAIDRACDEARGLAKQGRFDEALRALDGAEIRYPGSLPIAALRAEIEQERGKMRRKAEIDQALAKAADLVQKGQLQPGLKLLEEALQICLDSRELKEAATRLRNRIDEEERKRELSNITGAIQQAIATQDWNRALSHATGAYAKFPGEEIARLKRQAEEGKQRKEIEEAETGILQARKSGNLDLAAELATAARIRWAQERRFEKLEHEIQETRAEQKIAEARTHVNAGRLDEAEKLARQALKRCPNLPSANDLLADVAARREAKKQLQSREESKSSHVVATAPPSAGRNKWILILAALGLLIAIGILWKVLQPSPKPPQTEVASTSNDSSKSPSPSPAAASGTTPSPIAAPALPSINVLTALDYPEVVQGQDYNNMLHANGGTDLTWSTDAARLPKGLLLDKNGRIHGRTSAHKGIYSFEATATDPAGNKGSAQLNLTVLESTTAAAAPSAGNKQPAPQTTLSQPDRPKPAEVVAPPPAQPQSAAVAPKQCKAFDWSQYFDITSGDLVWNGSLDTNGQVEIHARNASTGKTRGEPLRGKVPVRITFSPDTVRAISAPSSANCYDAPLILKNTGAPLQSITIHWDTVK